jgi:hypothetical protein
MIRTSGLGVADGFFRRSDGAIGEGGDSTQPSLSKNVYVLAERITLDLIR